MRLFSVLFALCLCLGGIAYPPAQAATPDELYLDGYRLMQEGDGLSKAGRNSEAREKYVEAQKMLKKLQTGYPTYNKNAIEFRLEYLEGRISEIPEEKTETPEPAVSTPREQGGVQPVTVDAEIKGLQERVTALEADNKLLQAKLQEALAARPAEVDPQELAKARERINLLEKEKELLRASLAQAEAKKPQAADAAMLEQARRELEATQKKLADSAASIATLSQEKIGLQTQLAASTNNAARIAELEQAVNEAKEAAKKEAGAAAEARKRVAQLEQEQANWKTERAGLEEKAKNRGQGTEDPAVANQLKNLRARLEVFEARKVPYTKEELALLDKSGPQLAKADPKAGKKSIRELPPGSSLLVAEAERAFAAKRYEEAEDKYKQILKMDEDNAVALANISAIEIEMNKFNEADANLAKAAAASPDDSYVLLLQGMLRMRQERFDDALTLLSRSAQLDPKNAEAQNYLGVVLSQLGQREAAETALRKALALAPNYAGAHHNLAFVYATQRPPALELAKYHYNKALSLGHPQNPELEKELKISDSSK